MKKALTMLALACLTLAAWATDLVIEQTDGTTIRINTSGIRRMSFAESAQETQQEWTYEGLLAHWALNGDTFDYSGAGLNATNAGAKPCAGINGKDGWAMGFKGNAANGDEGGHILLPHLDLAEYKQLTISLWVKENGMENLDGEAYIFFGDHFEGCLGIAHFYGNIEFLANENTIKIPYRQEYTDNWVHYALTSKDGSITGYINGQLVGSQAHAPRVAGNNAALGRHWWGKTGTSTRFTGCIDEVRIYSRALSPEELVALSKEGR